MDETYRSTTETIKTKKSRREIFLGIKWQLYYTHALQAWGDRWWGFSLGLFLVILSPDEGSLRVTALNSISISISLILLLHVIGYWIDLSRRLHVIRVTVLVQNLCAVVSNILIYILLDSYLDTGHIGDWSVTLYLAGIIFMSVVGRLSSAANSIAIEKDWVVVIANAGHFALTDVNATMRRIDMVTNIVAPIFVGFLMEGAGRKFTALFIAVWNVVSALLEYSILVHVYTLEPALSVKANSAGSNENVQKLQQEPENAEMTSLTKERENIDNGPSHPLNKGSSFGKTTCSKFLFFFLTFRDGFKIYNSYTVKYAGFALALLFLTVLNFNAVTNGYMLLQGLSEGYLSLTMAASSCMGVVGTIIFPFLKNRLGLIRTTMVGSIIQITCVSISVASFFLPGSTWHVLSSGNSGTAAEPPTETGTGIFNGSKNATTEGIEAGSDDDHNYMSVIVFAIGIIFSRAGLWTFDLGVTQMIQESVDTSECGRFNSFQKALQSSFDLIYLTLVIALPRSDTYAWLGFVSYSAVIAAFFVLVYYLRFHSHAHDRIPQSSSNQNHPSKNNPRPHPPTVSSVSMMVNENYSPITKKEEDA
ncbi:solute carrier family 40 member 1-like isoform X2 [Symsagittifera roscoffensis]|uniref:solute carrier family 40 member 1-like isoform X2 n=1 Tax=Symsagittifera roscoffensis TaxID=84072 RepID=UPI00307C5FEC